MIVNVIPFLLFVFFLWSIALYDIFPTSLTSIQKKTLYIAIFLTLVIFAGGRWSAIEVGYDGDIFDYSTYKNIYHSLNICNFLPEYTSSGIEIKSIEIGYLLYSSLCSFIFDNNFNVYLLFTNFLLILLLYKSLKDNEIKYGLFFILFFFAARLYLQYNFIILRQAIALFIVWAWGFPFLLKNEKNKFVLTVFLASTFHITSIIAFLAIFLNRTIHVRKFVILICMFFVLSVTKIIDMILLYIIDGVLSIIGVAWMGGEKLSKYLLEGDGEYRSLNILTFVEAIPFFYIIKKFKVELCQTVAGRFYHNMFYLFILLLAITMNFGFLTRGVQYFMFSYMFLLSFYIEKGSRGVRKQLFLSLLSCYFLIYSVRYIFLWFSSGDYSFFLLHIS